MPSGNTGRKKCVLGTDIRHGPFQVKETLPGSPASSSSPSAATASSNLTSMHGGRGGGGGGVGAGGVGVGVGTINSAATVAAAIERYPYISQINST